MTETIVTQNKLRKIEDLTSREIGMIYSLSRTRWSYPEIGRRYGISETDARTVVDNNEELRKLSESKIPEQSPSRNAEPITNNRKRRRDAKYATAKDRQAAYRAKLRERRRAAIEQASQSGSTGVTNKVQEESSVTVCHGTVSETGPDNRDPQRSTNSNLSVESPTSSENILVAPQPPNEVQA